MKPLFMAAAMGMKLVEGRDGYYEEATPSADAHGPGCSVGLPASDRSIEDRFGRKFAGHWVVPPGREENRTLVTNLLQLPYDTTIHAIAVHLHPFAESVALRDLTTGETVYESRARNEEEGIGLARVDSYASEDGLPIFAAHEYEIVSVYDNPTDEPQDSMAVMFLYLLEKDFRRPTTGALSRSGDG